MATGTYMPAAILQYFSDTGDVLVSGTLTFYQAGTTTLLDTYSDVSLTTPNQNPLTLNGAGRPVNAIFFSATSYKVVLKDSAGVTLVTRDNVAATPASNVDLDLASQVAGESVSATNLVFLADGSGGTVAGRWNKADSDALSMSTLPAQLGFVVTAYTTGDTGTIRIGGRMTGFVGLVAGADYYVSATPGAITASPSALRKRYVGTADSTTSLIIGANPAPTTSNASRTLYTCGTTPGTGIAAGATAYLGTRGRSATETSALDVCPVAGTMKNLFVRFDGSPGAGQSFTVTVRKNSGATVLTCIVSDANPTNSDLVNTVAVAAGDAIDVQVVASAGASTRECAASFEVSY